MNEQQEKALSNLALQLRVLKPAQKNKYLFELDRYAWNCHIKAQYLQPVNTFFAQRLASQIYCSLEGKAYIRSDFSTQTIGQDIQNRKKFNSLLRGITAYVKASDAQKTTFEDSVLESPNLIKKLAYLIKIRQNRLA